jgi:uncharacterized membrane protein YccC
LVRCKFNYFPIKGTVEGKITDSQRSLFRDTLCQTFCTMDSWIPKTMEDIRAMEKEVAKRSEVIIEKLRKEGAAPPMKEDGYWLRTPAARALLQAEASARALEAEKKAAEAAKATPSSEIEQPKPEAENSS